MPSSDITPTDLTSLAKRCQLLSVEKETSLIKQGDEGRRFYMILKGEAKVSPPPPLCLSSITGRGHPIRLL
jgi:CRP-like cAMP-binding protein